VSATRMNTATPASRWSVLFAPRTLWVTAFFLLWTIQAALYGLVLYHRRRGTQDAISLQESLLIGAVDWYIWAALCLLCFWIAYRLPLERYRPGTLIPLLGLIAVAVTAARAVIDQGITILFGWDDWTLVERLIATLPGRLILVVFFLSAGYAVDYVRRHRERELQAARLQAELSAAQLQMLKVQLQPHFLFNTLHAISSLMYIDVAAADRMLVRLSEMLRRTLQTMDAQTVTVSEELGFLEPYLEIEQIRLGDRLQVEMDVRPGTLTALVPHLVLQPLVENAIRHGIFPKLTGGRLRVEIHLEGGDLLLVVRDDGVGLRGGRAAAAGGGVGLANTRERLRHLYGDAASVTLEAGAEGGVVVSVRLPAEFADAPPDARSAPRPVDEEIAASA
jgi:two-component system, LytTR family, sensor kinase